MTPTANAPTSAAPYIGINWTDVRTNPAHCIMVILADYSIVLINCSIVSYWEL